MRCESSGDLYLATPIQPSTCLATTLATNPATTWHDHLGDPRAESISFIRNNNFIVCKKKSTTLLFVISVKLKNILNYPLIN